MTPEENAKRLHAALECWDTDWDPLMQAFMDERGLTRTEALLYIGALQMGAVRDAVNNMTAHPTFNPTCPHCIEQKRVADIQARYMESSIKFMAEHKHDDDDPLADWEK